MIGGIVEERGGNARSARTLYIEKTRENSSKTIEKKIYFRVDKKITSS